MPKLQLPGLPAACGFPASPSRAPPPVQLQRHGDQDAAGGVAGENLADLIGDRGLAAQGGPEVVRPGYGAGFRRKRGVQLAVPVRIAEVDEPEQIGHLAQVGEAGLVGPYRRHGVGNGAEHGLRVVGHRGQVGDDGVGDFREPRRAFLGELAVEGVDVRTHEPPERADADQDEEDEERFFPGASGWRVTRHGARPCVAFRMPRRPERAEVRPG